MATFSYTPHIIILLAAVIFYLIPSPIDPRPYYFPEPPPKLEGVLAINKKLQLAEKWFEGEIEGPESFAVDKSGMLYTGLADGRIISFKNGESWKTVARTGINSSQCGSFELEPLCGRPKAMKFDSDGNLVLVDSHKGLLKVHIASGEVETLVSSEHGADGVSFKFLNGLDISKDGTIYFTDSSTKWDRRYHKYEVMEVNKLGRLLSYNPRTKVVKTLKDQLCLPNGISLSADESHIMIVEMSVAQITKFHLKGTKKGSAEIMTIGLPGFPDNIHLNSKGTFYVGLAAMRYKGMGTIGSFLDLVGPYPAVKKVVAKILPLSWYKYFFISHAMFIEVDSNGKILASFHDPTAKVIKCVGEPFEYRGKLYIGHYFYDYIGVLDLSLLEVKK